MHDTSNENTPSKPPRIGLARSGGGFRVSIFHLGVIRRLEEPGIVKHVHIVSAVSGGAIIAAYCVIEMEKRLRKRRQEMEECPDQLNKARLEIFEEIATCFLEALDHNLRARALAFGPVYRSLLSLKSSWPGFSRPDIMEMEFDRWFYRNAPLDALPNVTLPHDRHDLAGPRVVLNATSLLAGDREGFKRGGIGLHQTSPSKTERAQGVTRDWGMFRRARSISDDDDIGKQACRWGCL